MAGVRTTKSSGTSDLHYQKKVLVIIVGEGTDWPSLGQMSMPGLCSYGRGGNKDCLSLDQLLTSKTEDSKKVKAPMRSTCLGETSRFRSTVLVRKTVDGL